jgi:hypothetical protein
MLSHLNEEQSDEPAARRAMADANAVLAEVELLEGDHVQAAEHADVARSLYGELRDLVGSLRADLAIGRARGLAGARTEARARIEAARAIALRLGDREAIAACATALDSMGVVVL